MSKQSLSKLAYEGKILALAVTNDRAVEAGGTREMSEAWYDLHFNLDIYSVGRSCYYDFALSGGEPYSVWY